jgi:hypothetical protein
MRARRFVAWGLVAALGVACLACGAFAASLGPDGLPIDASAEGEATAADVTTIDADATRSPSIQRTTVTPATPVTAPHPLAWSS